MMKKTVWIRAGRLWIQGLLLFGLRLAQNRSGFDPATGLSRPSVPGLVLAVALAVCAAAEAALCLRLPKARVSFSRQFAPPERETLLLVMASLLLAAGGALLALRALPERGVAAMAAGLLAVAAGAGFLVFIRQLRSGAALSVLPVLPSMFFSVFFVLTVYLPAESDPVLARFYIPVLAAASSAYAFSLLAGFLRSESNPRTFACMTNLAVLLNLTALADAGCGLGRLLLHAGCALLLTGFLLLFQEAPLAEDAGAP